ncbi:hypothetical protein NDU88_000813 [Pleurodeles waltl]|uniref:Uncharacterized protein n=1 Tax=Pleurodeles waltl TaxID=8319 RepID=A0AAV7LXX6_PLEWA|nr:hypothetical protein NDU88_000813 [Pleurodeles waltl]
MGHHDTQARSGAGPTGAEPACTGRTSGTAALKQVSRGEEGPRAKEACTRGVMGHHGIQVRRGAEGPRAKEACTRGVMGHHGTQVRRGAEVPRVKEACTRQNRLVPGETWGTAALKQVRRGAEGPRAKEACTRGVMGHHGTQARSGARPTGAELACTGRTSGTAAFKQERRGSKGKRGLYQGSHGAPWHSSEERGRAHRSRAGLHREDVGHRSTQGSEEGC